MNKILFLRNSLIGLLLLTGFISCKKENEPMPLNEGDHYKQYGTPFTGVPETQDIIMYEVNLRAFSANGNLSGVIDKLDHIAALGVNVIWLMPIHPIGQIKSVNSPYSIKDYKAVSSEYGSLSDLRRLTDEAHSRGIAVIMDWVANHTAWDHSWISNKTWYSQDTDGNIIHPPGTNWLDVADLNFDNHDMRKAMIDAMHFWVYEANIDGFRCDHADGVPFDFWRTAWQSLDTISGRKFVLFAEGARNDHFAAGFDLNFGWKFYEALKDVFEGQSVNKVFQAHNTEYSNVPPGKHWVRFTTNHDESAWDATPIVLFNGKAGALAASVVTVFTGGIPLIYSSQEVGTPNPVPFFSKSVINWNANPDMLEMYRKILGFYSGSVVAKRGLTTVYAHEDVACFKKSFNNDELLVIVNLRNAMVNYSLPPALVNSSWTDALTTESISLTDALQLEPYQIYLLR